MGATFRDIMMRSVHRPSSVCVAYISGAVKTCGSPADGSVNKGSLLSDGGAGGPGCDIPLTDCVLRHIFRTESHCAAVRRQGFSAPQAPPGKPKRMMRLRCKTEHVSLGLERTSCGTTPVDQNLLAVSRMLFSSPGERMPSSYATSTCAGKARSPASAAVRL